MVLKRKRSRSAVTRPTVLWRSRLRASSGASKRPPPDSSQVRRVSSQIRPRKREVPLIPFSSQVTSWSKGAMNSSCRRRASAPKRATVSSGVITLRRDLDILVVRMVTSSGGRAGASSGVTGTHSSVALGSRERRWGVGTTSIPWLRRRRKGSWKGTSPASYITRVQKRAYSRCSTACSAPPRTGRRASSSSSAGGRRGLVGVSGEVKRRKYQEEQAKPPMVSVSRCAGPPQTGQVLCTHSVARARGDCPEPSGAKSSRWGRVTGSSDSGTSCSPCWGQ